MQNFLFFVLIVVKRPGKQFFSHVETVMQNYHQVHFIYLHALNCVLCCQCLLTSSASGTGIATGGTPLLLYVVCSTPTSPAMCVGLVVTFTKTAGSLSLKHKTSLLESQKSIALLEKGMKHIL